MGKTTGIEWTDHTFNPWIGCTKISAGCANCYAKTRDDRHMLGPMSHWGPGAPRHITSAANWREPLAWARAARKSGVRKKVFCASQADVFELEAPVAMRQALWRLIGDTCDILDWQLLTKRPWNILPAMCDDGLNLAFFEATKCWLGTSVENQETADRRIPELLGVDAAIHFISAEPLLGALDLSRWLEPTGVECVDVCPGRRYVKDGEIETFERSGWPIPETVPICPDCGIPASWTGYDAGIDWVVCGGESGPGPGVRPVHPDWARSLRDQCEVAGVPFFFKQWGDWHPGWIERCYDLKGYTPSWSNCPAAAPWWPDGTRGVGDHRVNGGLAVSWQRIGKKAAGCRLDGVEHKAFPAARS